MDPLHLRSKLSQSTVGFGRGATQFFLAQAADLGDLALDHELPHHCLPLANCVDWRANVRPVASSTQSKREAYSAASACWVCACRDKTESKVSPIDIDFRCFGTSTFDFSWGSV